MTPERLAEIRDDVTLWHQMGMVGVQCKTVEELLAHIDAQQRTIEQLQADKAKNTLHIDVGYQKRRADFYKDLCRQARMKCWIDRQPKMDGSDLRKARIACDEVYELLKPCVIQDSGVEREAIDNAKNEKGGA